MTRTGNEPVLADPPVRPLLLTVKVSLDDARPPIWRRLELRGDLTLDQVHDYLQAAMGWDDMHLHRFEPGPAKNRWRGPSFLTAFDIDEGERGTPEHVVRLDQVLTKPGDRLFYTYDFGDDWAHTILTEKVGAVGADTPPAVCRKAVRACPPEDVGGIYTWNALAAELRDNPDPTALGGEFEQYAEWLEPGIDPEDADLAGIELRISLAGL